MYNRTFFYVDSFGQCGQACYSAVNTKMKFVNGKISVNQDFILFFHLFIGASACIVSSLFAYPTLTARFG